MKRFNLLSILILFFTLLNIQSVVADTTIETNNPTPNGTTGYYTTTAYITSNNENYYRSGDNEKLIINLLYPSKSVSFDACAQLGSVDNREVAIDQYIGNWSELYKVSINTNYLEWFTEIWTWTNYNTNNISSAATKLRFRKVDGTLGRYIRNIKVQMAPHIRLKDNLLENNQPKSYTFPETEIGGTPYYTIDFKSFLSSTTGQIEISTTNPEFKIRKKNEEATSNNVTLAPSIDREGWAGVTLFNKK